MFNWELNLNKMSDILVEKNVKRTLSYQLYRSFVKKLISEGKSTGENQTEEILNYSILNDKRMDRLDKTLKLNDQTIAFLNSLNVNYTFLVIAEGWCGDAAQILPILNKIAEGTTNIDLKIALRDENEELMNAFLTNGSKSIPKLLLLDYKNNVIGTWGPRPAVATQMVQDYKRKNGAIDVEFKKHLQVWYNKDKGNSTQEDIVTLLKKVEQPLSVF